MSLLTIIFLSVALAMDCFAVSISQSACLKRPHWGAWIVMAMSFGIFQGCMPLIGFYLMQFFAETITAYDHWVAFIILGVLGARMIKEDLVRPSQVVCDCDDVPRHLSMGRILLLALANLSPSLTYPYTRSLSYSGVSASPSMSADISITFSESVTLAHPSAETNVTSATLSDSSR